jgi:hypothetical protein
VEVEGLALALAPAPPAVLLVLALAAVAMALEQPSPSPWRSLSHEGSLVISCAGSAIFSGTSVSQVPQDAEKAKSKTVAYETCNFTYVLQNAFVKQKCSQTTRYNCALQFA